MEPILILGIPYTVRAFSGWEIAGPPRDFITGFIANEEEGEVYGRSVAIAIANDGSLLLTDDASDTVWRIFRKTRKSGMPFYGIETQIKLLK